MCHSQYLLLYLLINTSYQVDLETTKRVNLARSLKRHSSFASSVNDWLGFKFSDIFNWLPTGFRVILRSVLQIVLLIIILICSICFIVKVLMFYITKCLKPPTKTQVMIIRTIEIIHQATASSLRL